MTNEFKRKVLDRWFYYGRALEPVYNIVYIGICLDWGPFRKVILVQWHGEYQLLTCTDMFSGALVKTIYDIDVLIKTINSYSKRRRVYGINPNYFKAIEDSRRTSTS